MADEKLTKEMTLQNKYGMHVRPAGLFAKIASRFNADVEVEKDGYVVSGKSIMALMTLEAVCGTKLVVTATGPQAAEVLEELEALVARRFDIPDETAQGYLDVLGEKSDRLKKLIEDLVEASKASAGAMKVELTTVSLGELARQLLGEYADAFEERGLSVIFQQGDAPLRVCADSKLSYRVLDNLMGNIKKYAMPGTRVYLTLSQTADRGVLTLRNVSQEPLGIPVEELRERFVRGDRARSTEGSGLGLSIAEDLCGLQNAKLDLSIDGDLFTASVAFLLANEST